MTELAAIHDELQVRRLASLYAYALDHNDPDLLARVFTASGTWRWGSDVRVGLAQIARMPTRLRTAYRQTFPRVCNQVVFRRRRRRTIGDLLRRRSLGTRLGRSLLRRDPICRRARTNPGRLAHSGSLARPRLAQTPGVEFPALGDSTRRGGADTT